MRNKPTSDLHKTTRTELAALFGQTKLVLDETPRPLRPSGGVASFGTFLGQIGYVRGGSDVCLLSRRLPSTPVHWPARSPRLSCWWWLNAWRFDHCQWLRDDHVLHALLGLEHFPGEDFIALADLAGRGP